jgi:hypothetical protein
VALLQPLEKLSATAEMAETAANLDKILMSLAFTSKPPAYILRFVDN